ncbi:MAG: S9 family peptidase, partial [bacterium]|nr:S9 family peptidase [bacterium]
MKRTLTFSVLLPAMAFTAISVAQTGDASRVTFERLFNSGDYRSESFGPARWAEDGNSYTTLEPSEGESGGRDLVRYALASGDRTIVVSADRLIPSEASPPLGIEDYAWSADGRRLLVFTNTRRVWRRNTRGDYWVLKLENWELHQLGEEGVVQ